MSILVGYTATPGGADALRLGTRLAVSLGTTLEVVMVLPTGPRSAVVPPDTSYLEYVRSTAGTWLDTALARLPDGLGTGHLPHADSFAEGLVATARDLGATAIVVGASVEGIRGRHRVGSVASELLHSSDVPVVLAPVGSVIEEQPITRITAAIGTRPGADALLEEAVHLATAASVPLRLVSLIAVDMPAGMDTGALDALGSAHTEQVIDQARSALPRDIPIQSVLGAGRSVEAATADLDWEPGELVLVGSSRLARPKHLFLGSTAAKMLHVVPVPMMVVPRTRLGEGE